MSYNMIMSRTLISESINKIGETVLLKGWIQILRDQKNIKFIILRDISGTVQVVVTRDKEQPFSVLTGITLESVISVKGVIKSEPQAPGGIEILAEQIDIFSKAYPELPIPVVEKGGQETEQSKRLDWRWLDLRKSQNALIFKVWTTLEQAFVNFCVENDFIEIHSPKTLITSTESGSELFEIKYFDQKAYLAQSPQLYKQMAMASGFERVFEIGPVFRANPSFTSRHDTEFTMYDIEMSFIESHHDLMDFEEKMMIYIFEKIAKKHNAQIKDTFGVDLTSPKSAFARVSFREAKEILKRIGSVSETPDDLTPEEERLLSDHLKKETDSDFVFVYEYPTSGRAFYSMRLESDQKYTKSFDLLYKGLEVTSGAQREHRPEILEKQIIDKGFSIEPFKEYINFFKYGCPPHGGFAPGPSRLLMKMLGLSNVREVTYLYRGVNRLTP